MIEKNIVSFYNILLLLKIFVSKYNLSFMYINVYLIICKVMLIINTIISGKIEEWGVSLTENN